MKVKCKSLRNTALDDKPLSVVGLWRKMDLGNFLTVGKEYGVLGLEFSLAPQPEVAGMSVLIIPDVGFYASFDIELFEMTDQRVSRYWEAYWPTTTRFFLQHPLFHDTDLIEKLVAHDTAVNLAFDTTSQLLLSEFNDISC